eukprot:1105339_1
MCWGNHDQEDHEDVDFVDLEAQTGKQTAPPDLDRVRSGSMSGLKLTTANVAWAVGGLLLLVIALFVVFSLGSSPNKGLHVEHPIEEQKAATLLAERLAEQQRLADQQLLADQPLEEQSGAEEEADQEEELPRQQQQEQGSLEAESDEELWRARVERERRREMQKLADEQEEKEREELAATATRQSGFDSIIPTVNFSYRPIAANGFSADKEEVKEIRETEDDDEMEMDKWIKEEEKRENDALAFLLDLGYKKEHVLRALEIKGHDVEAAADWLDALPEENEPTTDPFDVDEFRGDDDVLGGLGGAWGMNNAALAPHMQPSGFQPSNNVVKPRSFGVLSHPPLPQNQPRSGTGLSNQSQTQQTQPVAPLSFSYNAASSIQPVIHQTQPSPLQYSKPMNPNNDWECTKCTATNKGSDKKCMICGTPNPALPEDPEQKVVQQDEKEQSAMVTTPRPKFYSVTWNSRNGGLLSVTLDDETSEHLQNDKSKSLSLELQTESSGGVWKSVCSCPKQGLLLNLQLLKNKKVGKNLRLCMKGPNGDEVFSETKEIPDGALRRLVQHRERKDRKAKQNAHNRFGSFTRS